MNLPEKASEFVDVACKALKFTGGTVHYYGFFHLPDSLENQKSLLAQIVERNRRKIGEDNLSKNYP
jgi:tRNA G37 N-methylase Trm5